MKKEHLEQWTDALESGLFSQTRYELFSSQPEKDIFNKKECPAGYCVIGVGCLILGLNYSYSEFREYNNLSTRQMDTLMRLNDYKEYNFNQLSQWIKKNIANEHTHRLVSYGENEIR